VCDPLKGYSWRYIKQNIAYLDPSNFIDRGFVPGDIQNIQNLQNW
jgi:hypothetical protein